MAKKGSGDGRDDLLDALFAAPPKEFVAERARVVAALKAAGRDEEARAVAKRKRPTASVWAVNALARRERADIAELLQMGASLRAGERKLLRGGGAEGFLDEARAARHKVAALTRRAEALLAEAGQKPTAVLGRKIAATLQAAAIADEETRGALAAGRIEHDLAPPTSFGAAGADLSASLAASLGAKAAAKEPGARPPSGRKHAGARGAKAEHAAEERQHAADARTHATDGKQAADARTHTADARTHTADARKHAADARKHAADARKRAADERKRTAAALREQRRAQAAARKHAATLARAATAAERVVAERSRAVDKARDAVERAESDLRAAKDALADAESAAAAARRAADEAAP